MCHCTSSFFFSSFHFLFSWPPACAACFFTSSHHVQLWRCWRIILAQPSPHLLPVLPSLLFALNLLLRPFILHLSLISPSWFSFFFCSLEMKVSARLHSLWWMSPNEEGLGRTPHPSPQTQPNTLRSRERGQIRGPYASDPGLGWSCGVHERFECMTGVLKKGPRHCVVFFLFSFFALLLNSNPDSCSGKAPVPL